MSSTNALGLSQITLQFNLSRSLDAAGPGRPGGHRQGRQAAAPGHAHPADLPEGEPRRSAGPLPGADLRDPAPVHRERVCRDPHGPAHLHDQRGGPGPDLRGAEVSRCASSWTPRPWPAGAWGSTRWPRRSRKKTSTCPPGPCTAPTRPLRCRPPGSSPPPRPTGPSSWPTGAANPCACRTWAG